MMSSLVTKSGIEGGGLSGGGGGLGGGGGALVKVGGVGERW